MLRIEKNRAGAGKALKMPVEMWAPRAHCRDWPGLLLHAFAVVVTGATGVLVVSLYSHDHRGGGEASDDAE